MANPQKENGYTAIANEILEALSAYRIPGECRQVLDCIFRKTYGYQKKEDAIANSQIVKMTKIKKGNVSRALSKLITNNVVIKSDNSSINILSINKDYNAWKPFVIKSDNSTKVLSEVITGVIRSDNKVLSEVMDTKERKKLYKRNIAKSTLHKDEKTLKFSVLGAEVLKLFEEIDPINKTYYSNLTQRKACDFLIETYSMELVKKIIAVLPKTNAIPYFPNITTPDKLQKKWVELKNSIDKEKKKASEKKPVGINNYIFTS